MDPRKAIAISYRVTLSVNSYIVLCRCDGRSKKVMHVPETRPMLRQVRSPTMEATWNLRYQDATVRALQLCSFPQPPTPHDPSTSAEKTPQPPPNLPADVCFSQTATVHGQNPRSSPKLKLKLQSTMSKSKMYMAACTYFLVSTCLDLSPGVSWRPGEFFAPHRKDDNPGQVPTRGVAMFFNGLKYL